MLLVWVFRLGVGGAACVRDHVSAVSARCALLRRKKSCSFFLLGKLGGVYISFMTLCLLPLATCRTRLVLGPVPHHLDSVLEEPPQTAGGKLQIIKNVFWRYFFWGLLVLSFCWRNVGAYTYVFMIRCFLPLATCRTGLFLGLVHLPSCWRNLAKQQGEHTNHKKPFLALCCWGCFLFLLLGNVGGVYIYVMFLCLWPLASCRNRFFLGPVPCRSPCALRAVLLGLDMEGTNKHKQKQNHCCW